MAWINDGRLLCNSCGVTNMQSPKQKSTLWTMQVGIFDGLVDDILYHLWIIPQSWFSKKRLRIHSIERLALNVAKRSLATICSRASLTLGLPYRVAIESVPEPNTQLWKRKSTQQTMEVGIFDVSADYIFYHLWIIALQCWILSQTRLPTHSIKWTICSRASLTLPFRVVIKHVSEQNLIRTRD